ncbi:MAG: hypothetical protein AVDCRST_MAG54-3838, partial [uncultured Actinomycetospora sp.]
GHPAGRDDRPLVAAVQRRATAQRARGPRAHARRGLLPPQPRARDAPDRPRGVDAAGRRAGRAARHVLPRRAARALRRAHGRGDAAVRRQPAVRADGGGRPAGRDPVGTGRHGDGALDRRPPRRRAARRRRRPGRHRRRARRRGRHRRTGRARALHRVGAAGEGAGAGGAAGVVDERRAPAPRARCPGAGRRPRLDRRAQRQVARARDGPRRALRRLLPGRRLPPPARRRRPRAGARRRARADRRERRRARPRRRRRGAGGPDATHRLRAGRRRPHDRARRRLHRRRGELGPGRPRPAGGALELAALARRARPAGGHHPRRRPRLGLGGRRAAGRPGGAVEPQGLRQQLLGARDAARDV